LSDLSSDGLGCSSFRDSPFLAVFSSLATLSSWETPWAIGMENDFSSTDGILSLPALAIADSF
jgi:hypothetical protein